jgi:NTE family protein
MTMASIPGAHERLKEIEKLAERQQATFRDFFVPLTARPNSLNAEGGDLVESPSGGPGKPLYLCNIVFQGGGVLGLAHIGFLAGLECAGIRTAGVAGTSAGAIVATGLACARRESLANSVASDLFETIASMPMSEFIDGPLRIRSFIKAYLAGSGPFMPRHWPGLLEGLRRLTSVRGLNPGLRFEEWLSGKFSDWNVRTSEDLRRLLDRVWKQLIDLNLGVTREKKRPGAPRQKEEDGYLLRVVATGMPVGLKAVFPRDLNFLRSEYMKDSPALFVRASMAIPGFFDPKVLNVEPTRWRETVDDKLSLITTDDQQEDYAQMNALAFVDGGLLSNLPVDAFEEMQWTPPGTADAQDFPTLVVTLVRWNEAERYTYSRSSLGVAKDTLKLLNAIRLQRDRDAARRLEEKEQRTGKRTTEIIQIDTQKHDWLNFTMMDDEMGDLFMLGLNRAYSFLRDMGRENV